MMFKRTGFFISVLFCCQLVYGQAPNHVLFRWPLTVTADYDGIPNYFDQTNFVDENLNLAPNFFDYNCGNRSYDGHRGIDISLFPFWWHMMESKYIVVVAAADGIVDSVTDNLGNDHNCGLPGQGAPHNVIVIKHSDGSTSWYYHLMDNSALVSKGDVVYEGQPIASPGSSGGSSNPHLHFEVHNSSQQVIDPYFVANGCTTIAIPTSDSWWKNQRPYWEPGINRVMTHGGLPLLTGVSGTDFCTSGELVNAKNYFSAGDDVYIGVAAHDMQANTSILYNVYDPSGLIIYTGSFTLGGNASRRYFVQSFSLGFFAQAGTYKIVATYFGTTAVYYFTVGCTPTYNPTGAFTSSSGFIAGSSITSNATLTNTSKIFFQAGTVIQLNPGFTASQGCSFKARIRDCNYSE